MMQHQHDVSSCIMALAWSSFLGHELTYTRKCFQNWRAVFLNIFVGSQERNNNPVHRRLTAPTSASTRCNGGRCAHLPCQTSLRLLWMSWVFQEVHTVWNGHSLTLGEPWTLVEDRGRAFFPGRFTRDQLHPTTPYPVPLTALSVRWPRKIQQRGKQQTAPTKQKLWNTYILYS